MQVNLKQIFLTSAALLTLWFLFSQKEVLTPFLLGAIFAYLFNPLVISVYKQTKAPKTLTILIIYISLIGLTGLGIFGLASIFLKEVRLITDSPQNLFNLDILSQIPSYSFAGQEISLRPAAEEIINTFSETVKQLESNFIPFFTGAVHAFVNVIIFLVSAFYFLRDGPKMINFLKDKLPLERSESDVLMGKINKSLADYLRGLVILIIIMSVATTLSLSILGVKFALVLGILTGFLEIVPLLGPITATLLAVVVTMLTGNNNFGLDPISLGIMVLVIYFTLRQIEDYFIIPQVLGHTTKLHPLIILFAVLVGGKVAGPLGFVLAVPFAAIVKILLEYIDSSLDKRRS